MLESLNSLFKRNKINKFKELFIFNEAVKKAFFKLYKIFTTILMFMHYNFNLLIQMKTDALK